MKYKAVSFPDLMELTSLMARADIIQIISLCLCHTYPTDTHTQLLRKSTSYSAVEFGEHVKIIRSPLGIRKGFMAGPFGLLLKQKLMGHEHDGKQKRKLEQRNNVCRGSEVKRTW